MPTKRRSQEQQAPKEHLRAAIRGLATRLNASLGASSPLGDSLTKGELREEDIVTAFRPHLPGRYDLVKGIVVNAAGDESDPQDVILLDTNTLPTFLGAGTTRLVPVEGVAGLIQIKSVASARNIRSAVANLASAKRLFATDKRYGRPPAAAIKPHVQETSATCFAGALFLTQRGQTEKLFDAYANAVLQLDKRERCDAICLADDVSILWGDPSIGTGVRFSFRGEQAEAPMLVRAKGDGLLFFYLSLVEHLANWIAPPVSWMPYIFGEAAKRRGFEFEYSYWYDEKDPPEWANRPQV